MLKVRSLVGFAAALTTISLVGSPAWGDVCPSVTGQANIINTYTAANFSCTVGPLTFANFTFAPVNLTLSSIAPFPSTSVFGLTLNFNGNISGPYLSNDVSWDFTVTGPPQITDVHASLNASASGTASVTMHEQIFDQSGTILITDFLLNTTNPPLSLVHNESFPPQLGIVVNKDEGAVTGAAGTAFASSITNAYSAVPSPVVGAGLPGLVAACGGLIGLARRRRRQIA